MPTDDVSIRLRLRDASRFVAQSRQASGALRGIGTAGAAAGQSASRGLGLIADKSKYAGLALAGTGLAATKMGLSFNAQMQSAQVRFSLFTDTAEQTRRVLEGVAAVDMKSGFDLGTLSDTAAYLGNAGIAAERLPRYLEGVANAAAAAGGGADKLSRIGVALGQIQSRGTITAEEINQLADAGVNVRQVLRKEFGLTGQELANIGEQGISSRKALDAITEHFTSGKMAKAAEAQSKTLGGQWDMLTGNIQKLSGALTSNLAGGLTRDVLPAANEAAEAITRIFGDEGLADEEKMRRAMAVIRRELAPLGADIAEQASLAFEKNAPRIMDAAGAAAPKAVGAFVEAWWDAGAWGKLVTAGFLLGKMGAFGKVAGIIAGRFATRFAAKAAPAMATGLLAQKSAMSPKLLLMGNWIGRTILAGIAVDELMDRNSASRGIGREEAANRRATPRSAITPAMRADINRRYPGTFPTGPGGHPSRGAPVVVEVRNHFDGKEVTRATVRENARRKARR